MPEQLAFIVRDRTREEIVGCIYVSKYGGTDGQDLAYRWVWGSDGWKTGDDGERVVETMEGTFAVWLPDGTQIVDY